ncbi:unnamed protein product [Schistosoma mattheei]|uniref:DUF7083 domain-containing protein n=1 Tax=Schistosoma mattheei TaxID=31246 RepID=A0A183NWT1_9TREM|nr:unnamed protein product [Schistosoma mattheei]
MKTTMNISLEQLEAYMVRQEKRFEESQIRIMETLMQKFCLPQRSPASSESQVPHTDSVINATHEFNFDGVAGVTFESWFKEYEDLFYIDLCKLDDASKVRILLRKLGTVEHELYSNFILPKNPRDFSVCDTVKTISRIFGEQSSLFNIRYHCLKLMKEPGDDWVKHAGTVNRECERSRLSSMSEDQFKCLVFICSLGSPQDANIRTRILSKLEHCSNMTLQEVTTECQSTKSPPKNVRNLETNKRRTRLQLDTASDITLISPETRKNIGRPTVFPTTQLAHSASARKLNIVGEVPCTVSKGTVPTHATVYLTKKPALDLMGSDLIETLRLADYSINSICR